jgi:hypothetical protein
VITCPVCEHQQATGAECEVCGRALAAFGGVDAPVAPLDGLEPTALDGGMWAGEVAVLPELEPTMQASAGAVASVPIPELEPTLAARVEAKGELVPDLEPTASPPSGDARTELPLFLVCRYCRTPAGPGDKLCARCGMRLQVDPGPAPGPAGPAARFCSCGTPITRSTCPACGARNRVE